MENLCYRSNQNSYPSIKKKKKKKKKKDEVTYVLS